MKFTIKFVLIKGMENVDLEASLVLYLCVEDIGLKKLPKVDASRYEWNLNIKIQSK